MDRVVVMMSTYNGEEYLEEQIDSVLEQTDVYVDLLVRDDGSTDDTKRILQKYSSDGKLKYYGKNNIGPARSFISLLFRAPNADYYAFSDQDDVWDIDKLSLAISRLKDSSGPALYHCIAGVVDEKLNPISFKPVIPVETFPGSLLTSATGCTIVINKKMMDILRTYRPNCNKVSMHDVWVYRVAYAVGADVVFDASSHMKYRQHGGNFTGGKITFGNKLKRIFITRTNTRSKTCQEVIKGFSKYMSNHDYYEGIKFAYYRKTLRNKLELIFDKEIRTNYPRTNIQNMVLILLGKM